MCLQSTTIEGTSTMQIQPKGNLGIAWGNFYWLLYNIMLPWQVDAHIHYHCQVINNNRYYPGLVTVVMATIEVGYI